MSDEVDPVFEAAWRVEGGYPREALEMLRADPGNPRVCLVRARALADLGETAEAEEEARRGLAADPENVDLLEVLAAIQMATDAWAAEHTLRRAMELSPENPRLLALYVFILMEQGRYEWAETLLERLMRIAPEEEMTQRTRAMFLMRAANSSDARKAAMELLRENPDEAFSHYLRGLSLMSGRWWRGVWHLRQAAAMRPQDPVLVETARVLGSPYLLPVHIACGPVRWVVLVVYGWLIIADQFEGGANFWWIMLVYVCYLGLTWGAYGIARAVLQMRIARALRER